MAQQHVAVKHCKHGTFLYNPNDIFIGRSLDLYGEWAEAELDLLGRFLKPGDVALDVGANIGTHCVFFAKKVSPGGLVYAFEPQRLVFQNLCANIALNGLANVSASPVAVGDQAGHVSVPVFDPDVPMNFGSVTVSPSGPGEIAALIRLDEQAAGTGLVPLLGPDDSRDQALGRLRKRLGP
jgi:FkbM family methyltransferase